MTFLEARCLKKSFPSPDGGKSLVVDLEKFSLKPESLCGMKGESGSGKSTIIQLIERFYDVDSGSLTINGNDVKDFSLEALSGNLPLRLEALLNKTAADRKLAAQRAAEEDTDSFMQQPDILIQFLRLTTNN